MTITKEGALASFYTVNKAPIKHLKVYFSPKQAGSGDASPSNVREISGWNSITFNHCGKNLFYFDENNVKIILNTAGNQRWGYEFPIEYTDKEMIVSAIKKEEDTQTNFAINLARYNKGQTTAARADTLLGTAGTTYNISFVPNMSYGGSKPALISSYNSNGDNAKTLTISKIKHYDIQCELGTTATKYEPYKGTTQTIDWSNDIGTIYGGYIDLITGKLINTHQSTIYTGANDEVWTQDNTRYYITLNTAKIPTNWSRISVLCNMGESQAVTTSDYNVFLYNYSSTDYANPLLYYYPPTSITTVSEFKTWLSTNNLQVVYELKEPIEYQLTPNQLQTFIGQNNIWSNADRVEIEYDLAESNDELYRRRNIILQSSPYLETATSDIVNFDTDVVAPIKDVKIYFNPIQEGEDDPSPENIKTINGKNKIQISYCNKNILDPSIRINNQDAVQSFGGDAEGATNGDLILPAGTYTFSTNGPASIITIYKKGGVPFSISNSVTSITFTLSETTEIGILYVNQDLSYNYQLEVGSTATEYIQYNVQTISIDWASNIGTIYGGYIDLINGILVKTYEKIVLDGTNLWLTSGVSSAPDANGYVKAYNYFGNGALENYPLPKSNTTTPTGTLADWDVKCDILPINTFAENIGQLQCIATGLPYIRLYLHQSQLSDVSSKANILESMKGWLQAHPVTICYKPIQTQIYQLTPQQLLTFRGTNNIWSNANGPVSITYWTH